jgi:SH3 domain protein
MRSAFLLLILLPLAAGAETAYVTDNLRLGLHQAADTSDRAFRTLESGQELEILSRDRNYASVRLPDGVLGNVKVTYLVFDKPARLIVAETQAALEALQSELDSTKAAFAAPAATIATLESQLAESEATLETSTVRVSELSAEVDDFQARHERYKFSLPFKWVSGAMFVCLLAGFLGGLWWIDYRSRKRHGGIRIY